MRRSLRHTLLALACALPLLSFAQAPTTAVNVPPGDLVTALDTFTRQSGAQLIYPADQLKGLRTAGVSGTLSTDAALARLLSGSGYSVHQDSSGALLISRDNKPGSPSPPSRPSPASAGSSPQADASEATRLDTVTVTGSRIPRSEIEGPAPVLTITAEDIARRGFADVPQLMASLTQNLGALDNNQYNNGFSVGAQAVDLRGLGPNHTLVLVNGRRIADYPQSYGGNSNFTDISNIPTSLIERVEILSGSASAVYGSDAISGVINFILKKKVDHTSVSYRIGTTQHGGGNSQRFDISSGFSVGKLDAVFGLELVDDKPLWAMDRSYTDSQLDSPADPSRLPANRTFVRTDVDGNYLDPGKATCDNLSYLDRGSVFYASRRGYGPDGGPGYYCGTYEDYGYSTLENGRRMANFFGSGTFHFNDYTELYVDLMASTSHQDSYSSPKSWWNCEVENSDCADTPFYNVATGQVEQWGRQYFTINEWGGFKRAEIRSISNSYSLNTGVKGTLGAGSDWNYEANFSHSQNQLTQKWPAVIAAKAQSLYLGPSLGIDPDSGYKMYDAPLSRLYTPLTVTQLRSISQDSNDHDKSRAENWSLTFTNTNLFDLPAGPVSFAGVAEYGNSYFGLKADPMSLDGSYYNLHNTTAVGSRSHAAAGYEFNIPIFSNLTASTAGRYDRYSYGATDAGKFTYAFGLEYRPIQSLLLRGSISTGFRAPDLSYLYAGLSGSSSSGIDYYLCRTLEPDTADDFSDDCSYGDESYNGQSHGSTDLKDETSRSFTWGAVFAPTRNFDISMDYYRIKLKNEVLYQSTQDILRREGDCRLGATMSGTAVDGTSAFCQQIESQVFRNAPDAPFNPGQLTAVLVLPINAATDETSGVDFNTHYRLDASRAGTFDFNLGATYVIMHKTRLSTESPVENQLTDLYNYLIPRSKANGSVTWNFHHFTTTLYGSRLSGIPDYNGTKRMGPTARYNLTMGYQFTPDISVSMVVDNLFDRRPPRDPTWTGWPYYYRAWFDAIGRAYFLQANVRFGGSSGG